MGRDGRPMGGSGPGVRPAGRRVPSGWACTRSKPDPSAQDVRVAGFLMLQYFCPTTSPAYSTLPPLAPVSA